MALEIKVGDPGLYWDATARDGAGARISTHSMIKTFRRCPKQAEFKYVHRLKPRLLGTPLKRGTWMHSLLEEHHAGRDWRIMHAKLSAQFADMLDEERDFYGDMPTEIGRIMESYIWHYKADPWIVHETEFQVEAELPDGSLYRGKVDALIENQFGLWVIDHKTHKRLPDYNFRLLDAQSALYIWAARQNDIPVQGFIWNYITWKAPTDPANHLLKDGSRLSKTMGDTDYPTFVRGLKKLKEERGYKITQADRDRANYLKSLRYDFDKPQESPFFRRDVFEKNDTLVDEVVREATHTSERMHSYFPELESQSDGPITFLDGVERVVDRSCTFSCSYTDLCTMSLMGANTRPLIRQNYKQGDPNDYYADKAGDAPEKE